MRDLIDKFYAEANSAMQNRFTAVSKASDVYNAAVTEAYDKERAVMEEQCRILFDTINLRVARMLGEPSLSDNVVKEIEHEIAALKNAAE